MIAERAEKTKLLPIHCVDKGMTLISNSADKLGKSARVAPRERKSKNAAARRRMRRFSRLGYDILVRNSRVHLAGRPIQASTETSVARIGTHEFQTSYRIAAGSDDAYAAVGRAARNGREGGRFLCRTPGKMDPADCLDDPV